MTRFLQVAALSALFFVVANASEANGPKAGNKGTSGNQGSHQQSFKDGHDQHRPSRTYSHDHRWSSRYWNSRYGCEFCYSSYDSCYFYFYAPANCYYPASYIAQYPPTPVRTPPAPVPTTSVPPMPPAPVVNVNQNTNVVH